MAPFGSQVPRPSLSAGPGGRFLLTAQDFVMPMYATQRRRAAVHEAAHATLALLQGMTVERVLLVGAGAESPMGSTIRRKPDDFEFNETAMRAEAVVLVGGRVAEVLAGVFQHDGGPTDDLTALSRLSQPLLGRIGKLDELCRLAEEVAASLLELHWQTVLAVAQALETRGSLDGQSLRNIVFYQFKEAETGTKTAR